MGDLEKFFEELFGARPPPARRRHRPRRPPAVTRRTGTRPAERSPRGSVVAAEDDPGRIRSPAAEVSRRLLRNRHVDHRRRTPDSRAAAPRTPSSLPKTTPAAS